MLKIEVFVWLTVNWVKWIYKILEIKVQELFFSKQTYPERRQTSKIQSNL